MPYITKEERPQYEDLINQIVDKLAGIGDPNKRKGHYNYIIFAIYKRLVKRLGIRYHNYSSLLGDLVSCVLELYRTQIGPYENEAREKNGDVE